MRNNQKIAISQWDRRTLRENWDRGSKVLQPWRGSGGNCKYIICFFTGTNQVKGCWDTGWHSSRISSCLAYWERPTKLLIFYANCFIRHLAGATATHLAPAGCRAGKLAARASRAGSDDGGPARNICPPMSPVGQPDASKKSSSETEHSDKDLGHGPRCSFRDAIANNGVLILTLTLTLNLP